MSAAAATASTTSPTELRALTWEHERGYGSQCAAAARYRELTGTTVRVDARSLQAFADAPLEQVTVGYDLVVLDHPHIPLAVSTGLLAPLDGTGHDHELDDLARHSVGRSHLSYAHDGHQWGLAHDAAAHVAAYRHDLLSEPPQTWDQVLELAGEGRVLWPGKPIDAFSSLCTLAAHAGANPPVGPDRYLPADLVGECLEVLHRLTALVPPECLTYNPIQVAERLVGDEGFAYAPLLFGYTNYSRAGYRPHRLRYVDMPVGRPGAAPTGSLLAGAGLAVLSASNKQPAAIDFAFWVAGRDAQCGVYFDGGGQPGHAAAWEDDRLNAETLDFFRGTRASLKGAWMRPRTPGYIAFQDTVSPLVTACLRGEIPHQALIAALDSGAERWLASAEHDHEQGEDRRRQEVADAHS